MYSVLLASEMDDNLVVATRPINTQGGSAVWVLCVRMMRW